MEPGRHAALIGSTASGKSQVALALAEQDPVWELVTVDSMQVYRGMDIGTATPTASERARVPHHLLDVVDPWEDHDVATHQAAVRDVVADIETRGRRALLVGGTALYVRAVVDDLALPGRYPEVRVALEAEIDAGTPVPELHQRLVGLDPAAAERMEPTNRRRVVRALEVTVGAGRPFSGFGPGLDRHPPTPYVLVGLRWPRDELDRRIADRFRHQMDEGFLDEVRRLHGAERPLSRSASQALGYKELADHLDGRCSLDEAVDLAVTRTRRFSRRQEKWFRRDPRVRWVDVDATTSVADAVSAVAAHLADGDGTAPSSGHNGATCA